MAYFINSPIQFYTYVYRDPRPDKNLEPIYVGKGHGNRYLVHEKSSENIFLKRKLNAIKMANYLPKIEIWNVDSEEMAFSLEIWFIHKYGRIDLGTGTLCNLTDGGDGASGVIMTCPYCNKSGGATMVRWHFDKCKKNPLFQGAHTQKPSKIVKCPHCNTIGQKRGMGRHFDNCKYKHVDLPKVQPCITCGKEHDGLFGKYSIEPGKYCSMFCSRTRIPSQETRDKISKSLKGNNPTDETRKNISKALKGRKQSPKEIEARAAGLRGIKQKIVKCPYCNTSGGKAIMKRWHFDKCENKPSFI